MNEDAIYNEEFLEYFSQEELDSILEWEKTFIHEADRIMIKGE